MTGFGDVPVIDYERLNDVSAALNNMSAIQQKAAAELFDFQVQNMQELLRMKVETEAKAQAEIKRLGLITSKEEQARRLKELADEKARIEAKADEELKAARAVDRQKAADYKKQLAEQVKQGLITQENMEVQLKQFKDGLKSKTDAEDKARRQKNLAANKAETEKVKKLNKAQMQANAKEADKIRKKEERAAAKAKAKETSKKIKGGMSKAIFDGSADIGERISSMKEAWKAAKDEGGTKAALGMLGATLISGISDIAKKLENTIDEVGSYKSGIDTRLQGSKNKTKGVSYYDRISGDIVGIAGVSPLVKQKDIINNIQAMVNQGIAFDVEQRAFLQTIKDKIATTFDATDGTLRRLIRMQQQDSTAARLGMESALNAFLNNMYETTEYLSDLAASVRSSLEEAQALMNAAAASELEFEVQKWLGSMYSVGMSQSGVNSIASALGKLAAGDIGGITEGGSGNLLVMAANEAGLSVADLLKDGLDAPKTNRLLSAVVDYLTKIYSNSQDNKVVQQQIAKVYGLTASDLKALSNIGASSKEISATKISYNDMLAQLMKMADSMNSRVSMGEKLNNMFDNLQFTMAAGIANSPALYGIYKFAGLLDSTVGGIAIPAISVMGTMVDLETTVADLMRVGALSASFLKGIGQMAKAGSGGGISGRKMLTALGVSGNNIVSRGIKTNLKGSGSYTVSESGSVIAGNEDSSAVEDKTMADAADSKKSQMAQAKAEDDQGDPLTTKTFPELEPIKASLDYMKSIDTNVATIAALNFAMASAYGVRMSHNGISTIKTALGSSEAALSGLVTTNTSTNSMIIAGDETAIPIESIATNVKGIYDLLADVIGEGKRLPVAVDWPAGFSTNGTGAMELSFAWSK